MLTSLRKPRLTRSGEFEAPTIQGETQTQFGCAARRRNFPPSDQKSTFLYSWFVGLASHNRQGLVVFLRSWILGVRGHESKKDEATQFQVVAAQGWQPLAEPRPGDRSSKQSSKTKGRRGVSTLNNVSFGGNSVVIWPGRFRFDLWYRCIHNRLSWF